MAEYSTEFKIKVVRAYLNNEGRYKFLAIKDGVSDKSTIRNWVKSYNSQEYDRIKEKLGYLSPIEYRKLNAA